MTLELKKHKNIKDFRRITGILVQIYWLLTLDGESVFATAFSTLPTTRCITIEPKYIHASRKRPQPVINAIKTEINEEIEISNLDSNFIQTEENDTNIHSKKEIVVNASIVLPFSSRIAFDAYTDLTRQPTWSPWLKEVTYVESSDCSPTQFSPCGVPLRETKWVMAWNKIRFSWKSRVTKVSSPKYLEWESISGLKNKGSIHFCDRISISSGDSIRENNDDVPLTHMTLKMTFIAPKIVASLLKKSSIVSNLVQNKMLKPSLSEFRYIVMKNDLELDEETIQTRNRDADEAGINNI